MARIILIESDRVLAQNFGYYLMNRGHYVSWHVDPQTAMDDADESQPDIILLDLLLAGRSGIEFLYEFRSYADWRHLPVVVISNIAVEDLGQCIDAFEQLNVSAYRYKPTTSLSQLANTIEQALVPASR